MVLSNGYAWLLSVYAPIQKGPREGAMATTVLVVDDDPEIRTALRFVLEDEGYTVHEAPDGNPALERLHNHPDGMVVLLDLNMPGVDGIEVMRAVAAHEPLITRHAYILMTANLRTLPLPLAQQLSQLRVPVLSKPFDMDHLLEVIAQAAERITP